MTELRDDLRELDACLATVPVPEGLEARIMAATTLERATPSPARRTLVVGLAFAAGVVLSLVLVRGQVPRAAGEVAEQAPAPTQPERAAAPQPQASPKPAIDERLAIRNEDCAWSQSNQRLRFASGCQLRLADPAMDLEVWSAAELELIDEGVAVHEGDVMFVVEHVADPLEPARVGTSGGTIEILGTRFAVHQAREGGHVDLIEGAIQFRALDGEVIAVEPGRRHAWLTGSAVATPELDEAPARPQQQPGLDDSPGASLAEGLAEVARLRRAGELGAAIARLDELATNQHDQRTLEVISYERGTLVERSDTAGIACRSWAAHQRSFPSGRYDAEVGRRLARLECEVE